MEFKYMVVHKGTAPPPSSPPSPPPACETNGKVFGNDEGEEGGGRHRECRWNRACGTISPRMVMRKVAIRPPTKPVNEFCEKEVWGCNVRGGGPVNIWPRKMALRLLTNTLPRSNVHSSKLPCLRMGMIFLAYMLRMLQNCAGEGGRARTLRLASCCLSRRRSNQP